MSQVFKTVKYSDYLGEERPLLDIVVQQLPITQSVTPTMTVTPTVTPSFGFTPTPTPSVTYTNTPTPTLTPSNTPGLPPSQIEIVGGGGFAGTYTKLSTPAYVRFAGSTYIIDCSQLWGKYALFIQDADDRYFIAIKIFDPKYGGIFWDDLTAGFNPSCSNTTLDNSGLCLQSCSEMITWTTLSDGVNYPDEGNYGTFTLNYL